MKTTAEYIHLLKHYLSENGAKYGITRMGIFGSVARRQQNEDSDVDICYEGVPPSLLTLSKIQKELEDLLGCPVDMVRVRDHMNRYLKERINKEAIYV